MRLRVGEGVPEGRGHDRPGPADRGQAAPAVAGRRNGPLTTTADTDTAVEEPRRVVVGIQFGEDILYALIALLLFAGAAVVLVDAAWSLATDTGDDAQRAVQAALDSLLIVFILVELLAAVRSTITERKLVAEPFLLVGIIASIKEIVVVGAFADEKGTKIEDAMLEVGVLGGVVAVLAVASFLLRRKEREPSE